MKLHKADSYLWLNTQTGYYCAVYTDEQGKSRRKSLRTRDEKEAQRRFNAWRRDYLIAWGNQPEPKESTIMISAFLEEWIDHIAGRYYVKES